MGDFSVARDSGWIGVEGETDGEFRIDEPVHLLVARIMGAGASIPEQIDQENARKLAGDQFTEEKFGALADANGLVSRAAFLKAGGVQLYDAFLAHDWGEDEQGRKNHARVSKVCAALKRAGLSPWFDEDRMSGDINKAMADGLRSSLCVVTFLTERYIVKASGNGPNGSNDNCKYEFDTALMSRHLGVDKIIPVVMEPRLRNARDWPNGTVKGKLGMMRYINLTSDDTKQFKDGIEELFKEINETNVNTHQQASIGEVRA